KEVGANGVYRFRPDLIPYLDLAFLRMNPATRLLGTARDLQFLAEDMMRRVRHSVFSSDSIPDRIAGFFDLSSFISSEPFGGMLSQTLRLDRIRSSDKQLRIIATNWVTGEVKIFENKHMTDKAGHLIIMASSAIPGIFPTVAIEKDTFVDGGVV